jgi:putative DNA-invertase from lambdoid prophage Rac
MQVTAIVAKHADLEVRVHCLVLGSAGLTITTGSLTRQEINAVAQFGRAPLIERINRALAARTPQARS